MLEDREIGTDDQRRQAGQADEPEPLVGVAECRIQARQQEHAGLHHRPECRYADTGVGAAIACGSQKWNGNCALFVNARAAPARVPEHRADAHGSRRRPQHGIELEAADDVTEQQHTPSSARPPAP